MPESGLKAPGAEKAPTCDCVFLRRPRSRQRFPATPSETGMGLGDDALAREAKTLEMVSVAWIISRSVVIWDGMPHDFGQRQFALARALIAPHRAAASTSLVNLSERFSQMIIRAATSSACSFLERGPGPVSRRRVLPRMDSYSVYHTR